MVPFTEEDHGVLQAARVLGTGKSVRQEEEAGHIDDHAGQELQRGVRVPEAVRGGDLVLLRVHVLLAPRSIVHIQVISQFCQKRRRV